MLENLLSWGTSKHRIAGMVCQAGGRIFFFALRTFLSSRSVLKKTIGFRRGWF